jgi:hypothetical protein
MSPYLIVVQGNPTLNLTKRSKNKEVKTLNQIWEYLDNMIAGNTSSAVVIKHSSHDQRGLGLGFDSRRGGSMYTFP